MDHINNIAFIAGIVLLTLSLIGGGIEIKEIRIPHIGNIPRIMSFLSGITLMVIGLKLSGFSMHDIIPKNEISFKIATDINSGAGNKEIKNFLKIFVDSKHIGNIELDEKKPSDLILGKVSKEGEYDYNISGYTIFAEASDFRYPLEGIGKINIKNGSYFLIEAIAPFDASPEHGLPALRIKLMEKKD